MEGEKNGHHHLPETRGLCLSVEQTILRRPRIGAGSRIVEMITKPYRLVHRCEVTAILILYGLPRSYNYMHLHYAEGIGKERKKRMRKWKKKKRKKEKKKRKE